MEKYVFASRTFEGFCKDNNLARDEARKVLFGELGRLLKENARRVQAEENKKN